jgi:hypothetical protein
LDVSIPKPDDPATEVRALRQIAAFRHLNPE